MATKPGSSRRSELPSSTGPPKAFTSESPGLPAGQDPADLLADGSRQLLDEAIANAVPLEHHLIDQIVRQHNLEEPESIARAIHAAGPVVESIVDPAAQAQAVTYLATRVVEMAPSSRGTSRTAPSLQRAVEANRTGEASPERWDHHEWSARNAVAHSDVPF